MDLVSVATSGL